MIIQELLCTVAVYGHVRCSVDNSSVAMINSGRDGGGGGGGLVQ